MRAHQNTASSATKMQLDAHASGGADSSGEKYDNRRYSNTGYSV